ncbi:MAG TPA: peptidoglycan bridge formation glycyltransferase FemA/FemB family protein [Candidatus Dormibacteraeota bacterium]|nr:peptidoglycan bridge formation glycyltransferase FemA/FemB family protein [Candidatus Dormibacteraeota bacterium]
MTPTDEVRRWDAAIATAPNPHLLQSWRWGELQSRFGWAAERLHLEPADGVVPVSLLTTASLVPGRRFGYVPKGPVVRAEGMAAALDAIGAGARALGLSFVRVEPDVEAGWAPPEGWRQAPATQPEHTSVIDIARPDDELMASFKPKTRYNIRLAGKKGVQVAPSDDIGAFARLSAETSSRHGIQLAPERYYRELHQLMAADGTSRLYLASHEGENLAGIMVVRFAHRATYLFGASTRRGREKMPAYLLHWQAIRDMRDAGDREYDLWGVPPEGDPDHPYANLWQFKSGWQGRIIHYAGAFDLPVSTSAWRAHNALSSLRHRVRRFRSRVAAG